MIFLYLYIQDNAMTKSLYCTVDGLEDFKHTTCQNSQLHGSFTPLHGHEDKLISMEVDLHAV